MNYIYILLTTIFTNCRCNIEFFLNCNKIFVGGIMVILYKNLVEQGYSDYKIKKMLKEKKLFMVDKGIYSTEENYDFLECITKKHPNVIITLLTACKCYGLLDEFSDVYYVATKQKDRKIRDSRVKQIFMSDYLYDIGARKITYHNYTIKIYDLERTLIEIARNKINLDFDIYSKVIDNYKKISKLINKRKIELYLKNFKDARIKERIQREVFDEN